MAVRLAAVALRDGSGDTASFLDGLADDSLHVQQYLIAELLQHQSPAMRRRLCETSILTWVCAPLCDAVSSPRTDEEGLEGEEFIRRLEESGLPCDVLAGRKQKWLRYHHLFQSLLQEQLRERTRPAAISDLRRRAASWLEEHDLIEDAVAQLLETEDPGAAARLIVRQRSRITEREQWPLLDHWFRLLPAEVTDASPELLMLRAWSCDNRGRKREMVEVLERLEGVLEASDLGARAKERLRGEMDVLHSLHHYWCGRGAAAREHAQRALERLPSEYRGERAYATIMHGVSLQMVGELKHARAVVFEALELARDTGTFHGRVLTTLGFLDWISGDLRSVAQTGASLLKVAEEHDLPETAASGAYFQGIAEYQLGELSRAEELLRRAAHAREFPNSFFRTHATFALGFAQQAMGRHGRARETAESLVTELLERGHTETLTAAQAFEAELALRQGRLSQAAKWADSSTPHRPETHYGFYVPALTWCRVRLAQRTPKSHDEAADLLSRLLCFFESIHNTRFVIEIRALQALLHDARSESDESEDCLREAVALGQPGGFIRLYVDLGPDLARLLKILELDSEGERYVGRVLSAFVDQKRATSGDSRRSQAPVMDHPALVEPLTEREFEVLNMLARKLSNREIGSELYISPGTVKRHTENIYQKLGSHGRREAVAEALRLGILSAS